jgi:hypothetical protein
MKLSNSFKKNVTNILKEINEENKSIFLGKRNDDTPIIQFIKEFNLLAKKRGHTNENINRFLKDNKERIIETLDENNNPKQLANGLISSLILYVE